MTRETKIGLVLVLVLTCAFGLVVFKRIQKKNELLADAGEDDNPPAHIQGPPLKPTKVRGRQKFKQPRKLPSDHIWSGQKEPGGEGKTGEWHGTERVVRNNSQHRTGSGAGESPFAKSNGSTSGGEAQWNLGGNSHTSSRQPVSFPHEKGDIWDLDFRDFEQPEGQVSIQPDGNNPGGDPFGAQQTDPRQNDRHQSPGKVAVGVFPKETENSQPTGGGSPFEQVKTRDDHTAANNAGHASQPKPLFGPDFQGGSTPSKSHAGHSHESKPHNHQHSHPLRGGDGFKGVAAGSSGDVSNVHKTSGTDDRTEFPFGKPSDFKKNQEKPFEHTTPRKKRYEPKDGTPFGGRTTSDASLSRGGTARGQRPQPDDGLKVYTVAHGDNYWSISRKAYGSARYFRALDAYNRYRISHPKRMRPGMKVLVPKLQVLVARYPGFCPGHHGVGNQLAVARPSGFFRDAGGRPMYRVGKSDSLGKIAQKHLGRASRWIQIYQLNESRIKNAKQLTIGTELRLPADASRIVIAPGRRVYR